jgi:metallo-beta-lactamase family protein
LHEAGHILGSSSVELRSERSRVIVSGDLGRPDTPILPDYNTRWDAGPPVDLAVLESTYGSREHAGGHGDIERDLERILNRAVSDGGHVLVPAFAIGRTQILLYHLNTLVEAGRVPDLPVAVDTPLGLKITELYQESRHLFDREATGKLAVGDDPLEFRNLYAVSRGRDSVRLRDVKQPMLVIAGSGMCTGGRIVGHLRELLPRPETCVLFVGYQAAGTPGRAIQAARPGDRVRIDGEEVPVRAAIETLSGLSAHADRKELLRWLRALPAPRAVALHHGEPEQQEAFRDWATAQLAPR